ncbi:MAG: DsbA family protein [archaeon]|nr:DsbA family protein [archaeon]
MKTGILFTVLVLLSLFAPMAFASHEFEGPLIPPTVFASDQLPEPFVGSKTAPVVMEEFSDLECPFCERFHDQAWPLLKKEFVDTGKVRFIYRDLPLSFHKNAYTAALAAQCAHEQGKFWEMHYQLFANQQNLGETVYKKLAQELGLNSQQFNECLDTEKYSPEVQDDILVSQDKGVSGTPTFFINGKILVGAQPYDNFREHILEALGGEPFVEQVPEEIPAPFPVPIPKVMPETLPSPLVPLDEQIIEEPERETTKEMPLPESAACSDGCSLAGKCMGVSSRFFVGNKESYCGLELEIRGQKAVGQSCQNNFECLSNACSNGACVDLQKEIQETKGTLQQVLDWLSGLFGFKPK